MIIMRSARFDRRGFRVWPRAMDRVPYDQNAAVVVCQACGGSGCNRYKPKMTAFLREACPRCNGAGVDEVSMRKDQP